MSKLAGLLVFLTWTTLAIAQEPTAADTGYTYTSLVEAAKNPEKVVRLNLSHQKLTAVPLQVFDFKNLRYLNLGYNKLQYMPAQIEQLRQLEYLDFSHNKLKELPSELCKLTSLRQLILFQNDIDTLPPEIGQLKNLEVLDLWDNELGSLPESIKNLNNLKVLDLRDIVFTEHQLLYFKELLPETVIYSSPPCGTCKDP